MWNKIIRFLGYKEEIEKESIALVEKRIKDTNYTKIWIMVIFFLTLLGYVITKDIISLVLALMSLNFMNSLHISQKQDKLLLELWGR